MSQDKQELPYLISYKRTAVDQLQVIDTISLEERRAEWAWIEVAIGAMDLLLAGYGQDRNTIFPLLRRGKYPKHHSEAFSQKHDPHYRIIERKIFLEEISLLLP